MKLKWQEKVVHIENSDYNENSRFHTLIDKKNRQVEKEKTKVFEIKPAVF